MQVVHTYVDNIWLVVKRLNSHFNTQLLKLIKFSAEWRKREGDKDRVRLKVISLTSADGHVCVGWLHRKLIIIISGSFLS